MFRRRSLTATTNGDGALVGLDLNSSRIRAVSGPPGLAQPLSFDGAEGELPLAISLEGRHPEAGRAGLALCRRLPHLACLDFLPCLGQPRQWTAGRHCLTAAEAISLVLQRLQSGCSGLRGCVAAIPSSLTVEQIELFAALAVKAGLPLLGLVASPLAAAWAAPGEKPWSGSTIIVDIDDHALTWAVVSTAEKSATPATLVLSYSLTLPTLGLRGWKQRLVNAIAERCIRHSRRDPRECAQAEQMLFEQLDTAMEKCRLGELAEIDIQATHWYQNFYLRPDEMELYCAPLLQPVTEAMDEALTAIPVDGPPSILIVTTAAARLPGLLAAVQDRTTQQTRIVTLAPDAVARAAHEFAAGIAEGRLPRGPLETVPAPVGRRQPHAVANIAKDQRVRARLMGTDR